MLICNFACIFLFLSSGAAESAAKGETESSAKKEGTITIDDSSDGEDGKKPPARKAQKQKHPDSDSDSDSAGEKKPAWKKKKSAGLDALWDEKKPASKKKKKKSDVATNNSDGLDALLHVKNIATPSSVARMESYPESPEREFGEIFAGAAVNLEDELRDTEVEPIFHLNIIANVPSKGLDQAVDKILESKIKFLTPYNKKEGINLEQGMDLFKEGYKIPNGAYPISLEALKELFIMEEKPGKYVFGPEQ